MKPALTRRTRITARGRTKGGRGSLPAKIRWLHEQLCDICGAWPVEVHHDRRLGSRATDRKVVPLCTKHHRQPHPESVEVLSRRGFQERHWYDFDARCQFWQEMWEARA